MKLIIVLIPILHFLNHKTLDDIYLLQLRTFMHQIKHNELPVSFHGIFITNRQFHSHHTRHSCDFHVPFTRTAQAQMLVRLKALSSAIC